MQAVLAQVQRQLEEFSRAPSLTWGASLPIAPAVKCAYWSLHAPPVLSIDDETVAGSSAIKSLEKTASLLPRGPLYG